MKARRPDAEEIRPPSWARAPASRRSGFAFGSQLEPLSFLQEEQHMLRLLRWKMKRRSVAALLIRRKQGFQLKHRRPAPSQKLLFEKLSGVRKLTTFYLAKNDHRWVTFISLKTINSDAPHFSCSLVGHFWSEGASETLMCVSHSHRHQM